MPTKDMLHLIVTAVRLECAVKNYHWGKPGSESKVAQLAKANHDEFTIEEDQHYAEVCFCHLICIELYFGIGITHENDMAIYIVCHSSISLLA